MPETLIWTAIPNGVAAGKLRLSAHLSMRLEGGGFTVGAYPNAAKWDPTKLKFAIVFNGVEIPATLVSVPVPGLWQAYFPPDGPVEPFGYKPQAGRQIESFSTRAISAYLHETHGLNSLAGFIPPMAPGVLYQNPLVKGADIYFNPGDLSPQRLSSLGNRLDLKKMGDAQDSQYQQMSSRARTTGGVPTNPQVLLYEADRFFKAYKTPGNKPLASVPKPKIDFHKALALLGQHPALMRQVGVVFDLEVPITAAIAAGGKVWLKVSGFPSPATAAPKFARTFYSMSPSSFVAQSSGGSDLIGGFMDMSPDKVDIVNLDLNGGVLRMMDFGRTVRQALLNRSADSPQMQPLPAPKSAGVTLMRVNRQAQWKKQATRSDQHQANSAGDGSTLEFYAEDLFKGWRPDIFHHAKWHSLTARANAYRVGNKPLIETSDEGQISSAMTSAPDGTGPSRLHEALFTWDGWSLSARRPGSPVGKDDELDKGQPSTKVQFDSWSTNPANLDAKYKFASFALAAPGTLPALRFGQWYGIRARAVDLAGNSVPITAVANNPAATSRIHPYLRFDPVVSPALYIKAANADALKRGDSANILVVRKYAGKPTTEIAQRHIVAPEGGVSFAELHGKLDDANGKPDPAKYALIQTFDQRPQLAPFISADSVSNLPYLPDPAADGATMVVLGLNNPLVVKFYGGKTWPDPASGMLTISGGAFSGGATGTKMNVSIDPGQIAIGAMASNLSVDTLPDFNVPWAVEVMLKAYGMSMIPAIQAMKAAAAQKLAKAQDHAPLIPLKSSGNKQKPALDGAAYLKALLLGENHAITPFRLVSMVHACQIPEPYAVTKIIGTRPAGATQAGMSILGNVHNWSTLEMEFQARWTDDVDYLEEPVRTTKTIAREEVGFTLQIHRDPVKANTQLRQTAIEEFHDTKCHFLKYKVVAKTRFRDYFPAEWPTAADPQGTRFTETIDYKDAQLQDYVIIPSSRRPDPVPLEYVMPSFLWIDGDVNGKKMSARKGNLLRVYMRRPWFSSGNGEKLAVILFPGIDVPPQPQLGGVSNAPGAIMRRYATAFGADPAFTNPAITQVPTAANFPGSLPAVGDLSIVESDDIKVTAVPYTPVFDDNRQMWYVDIDIETGTQAYTPFVRLALARYQEHAVQGMHLSPLVVTDIAQLQPDRLAIVENRVPGKQYKVSIAGVRGVSGAGKNRAFAFLERKVSPDAETGWVGVTGPGGVPVACEVPYIEGQALQTQFAPSPAPKAAVQGYKGTSNSPFTRAEVGVRYPVVAFSGGSASPELGIIDVPDAGVHRIVIKEFEVHPSFTGMPMGPILSNEPAEFFGEKSKAGRLVYVDIVNLA